MGKWRGDGTLLKKYHSAIIIDALITWLFIFSFKHKHAHSLRQHTQKTLNSSRQQSTHNTKNKPHHKQQCNEC